MAAILSRPQCVNETKKETYHFLITTMPANALALSSARASAGSMMTNFVSHIHKGLSQNGLKKAEHGRRTTHLPQDEMAFISQTIICTDESGHETAAVLLPGFAINW